MTEQSVGRLLFVHHTRQAMFYTVYPLCTAIMYLPTLLQVAVACLTAVCEVLVSNPTAVGGLFIMKATVRYSLNTLTAVSRTTQPSILHGTAN